MKYLLIKDWCLGYTQDAEYQLYNSLEEAKKEIMKCVDIIDHLRLYEVNREIKLYLNEVPFKGLSIDD